MDEIDLKILRSLQGTPGSSMVDLAQKVGLSHTRCWRRVKQLEERGAIRERAVILDPEVMGLAVTVLANGRLKAHDKGTLNAFELAARERPEIVDCFSMGGESDYAVRMVVASIDAY